MKFENVNKDFTEWKKNSINLDKYKNLSENELFLYYYAKRYEVIPTIHALKSSTYYFSIIGVNYKYESTDFYNNYQTVIEECVTATKEMINKQLNKE